jgi:16S rRNA (cytosine967-C5)-methyltransferase
VYASIPLSRQLTSCADVVAAVRSGRSLNDLLPALDDGLRPGVQALAFHVLRHLGSAAAVRAALAPRAPPPRVDSLLTCALALLWPVADPPYPDHTLVDQAVAAARERTPAAAGFVNAVLRRFLRERQARVAAAIQDPVAAWNHPQWWIDRLRRDWPGQWRDWLESASAHPPMTLRVNRRRTDAARYVQILAAAGIEAHALTTADGPSQGWEDAVELTRPMPVSRLPGFATGEVSVQDASAQRAAPLLLGLAPDAPHGVLPAGARVLDACAAPGGKTAHLLECADLDVLALDSDAKRLARARDTLDRLQLVATLRAADASQPATWWDGQPFDAILLDAPCSASGIVRRHPDVRWLRRAEDLNALTRTQDALLQALWPLLKPGGRLVYATCSVFKAEGQDRIDAFVQRMGPDRVRIDPSSPGHLIPLDDNPMQRPRVRTGTLADGFYYALLHKLV